MRPLILVFVSCAFASAQIPAEFSVAPAALQLSLKHAVEIAITPEGSAKVALAQQLIRQSEDRVAESLGAFLPEIDGQIQEYNETVNLKAFGINFAVPGFSLPSIAGPFTVFDARASVQQSLFSYSDIRKYQASRISLLASRSDMSATKDQVSDQVARAYLACLRADADLETARANLDLSKALERLAQSQKDAGAGTGIEVTRAQVQLANDQQRLIVAENDRRRAVLQLLRAMGVSLDANVVFTDKLAYKQVDVSSLEASLRAAGEERPDLKAQQQREETAKLNYASVAAERLPSLQAFANYGAIGLQADSAQPTREYGIALKIPLFDGLRRDARRSESYSQYLQERVRTRDLRQQIELDVRLALDSLRSAEAQIATARDGLALAQNELAQAQRRYQAGVANSLEVTDAQTRLIRAQDNQTAAIYAHNLARIDLATATGTISEYVNQ
ncbi:MAG TPA: TolC family protein [Bryobacteraceae bacterium]|nr:TolC family protein [Bryobacteraceae bacterium]